MRNRLFVKRGRRGVSLLLSAGLFTSLPAVAGAQSARTVGDWTLTPSADQSGCFLSRQYDGVGATTLLLGLDRDGTNRLTVLNDNWSIEPQERLKLDFRLTNGGYVGQVAIGLASDGKRGFVTTFDAKFPAYFATSAALQIARGKVPVEQLSLAGSGAAVAQLRKCVASLRLGAGSEAAAPKPSRRIPKDPFSPDQTRRDKR
jgi:hypothetical protein